MCRNGDFDFANEDWTDISPKAIELIQKMLEKKPGDRISLSDVLENEWVKNPPRAYVRALYDYEKQKRTSLSKSIQPLQMSFPSTLPGSKLFGICSYSFSQIVNDSWYSPVPERTVEEKDDEVEDQSQDQSLQGIIHNPDLAGFTLPSFDSFEYEPKSVPYDMHIVQVFIVYSFVCCGNFLCMTGTEA